VPSDAFGRSALLVLPANARDQTRPLLSSVATHEFDAMGEKGPVSLILDADNEHKREESESRRSDRCITLMNLRFLTAPDDHRTPLRGDSRFEEPFASKGNSRRRASSHYGQVGAGSISEASYNWCPRTHKLSHFREVSCHSERSLALIIWPGSPPSHVLRAPPGHRASPGTPKSFCTQVPGRKQLYHEEKHYDPYGCH
jgi:hypothetical protein